VLDCYLDRNVRGSDHCPVFLTLSLPETPLTTHIAPISAIHNDLREANGAVTPDAPIHSDLRAANIPLNWPLSRCFYF
jgi:hypothetical protein